MTAESPRHHAVRIALVLLTVALVALVVAPVALAADTFRFDNETEMPFTPDNQDNLEEGCWYGATGVFRLGPNPSVSGSIRAEAQLSCERESWGSEIAFDQTLKGTWEQTEGRVYDWAGGVGAFDFTATDPLIGDSSVECPTLGAETEDEWGMTPIERFMTSEADGDVCTVEWLPGVTASDVHFIAASATPRAGHVRMIDALARVYGGKAHVRVQVFGLGHARHRNDVVLRTAGGELIGRASRKLRVGDRPQTIAVPLSTPTLKALGKGKDLRVHAAVDIDSPGGTGDTTSQLVLSERHVAPH